MPEIEAQYYEKGENSKVKCFLCPHHCNLKEGQKGLCRVRINREGRLFSLNYGEVAALALDPIEKKPLYHFYPGSQILSTGTLGCNLACVFCQNYSLAHENPHTSPLKPDALVNLARQLKPEGSIGVAFTYNEPSIWFEYIRETAEKLKQQDFKVVLVSNGFIEEKPFMELLPLIDAINIDVKAFNNEFYHRHCRGKLKAVLDTLERAAAYTHVEITTLLIPEENDNVTEIANLSTWLAAINPNIPLHLSRYYPAYKFHKAPTPVASLQRAQELAKKHLNFVYVGNVPGEENNTFCLECGALLIKRNIYNVELIGLQHGHCKQCASFIDYVIT